MKKSLAFLLFFFLFIPNTLAFQDFFIFGLRLQENEYELVPKIENEFNVKVPVVSVIYDDFTDIQATKLARTFKYLGNERVYHLSINPFGYNLRELINDPKHKGWELKYRAIFRLIKRYNVKVIFRSLHEMNGGWYSWSSDPDNFKIFWKMMWDWSREEGLSRANILFDMSVNSQDLPAVDPYNIYQGAPVITCGKETKEKTGCHTFEDYYPGDDYVDLLGITIYNWGKGARKEEWATWRDPMTVLNEPGYWTFDRMKKLGKPIFIDEAGTTSINVDGPFDELKLIDIFKESHTSTGGITATGTEVKNNWIKKLSALYTDPQVLGGAYFNADVTYGLNDRRQIGELDWTAIDADRNIAYPALVDLLNDYRNLEYPTFYFDLPDDVIKSKEWLNDEEIIELHDFVSKFMVFKEGNYILNTDLVTYKYAKYQLFLEKQLAKDSGLCKYISSKFPKISCPKAEENKSKDFEFAFGLMKNKVEASPIRLSNWGVWEQIEKIKTSIFFKMSNLPDSSKQYKTLKSIVDYYNTYERTYLDLR